MKKLLFLAFAFLPFVLKAQKAYYVDFTGGNDANAGTSSASPWKTLSKVNSASYDAGDSVLFKKGESWYGDVTVKRNDLHFGAYGTGAKPVISGFQTLTGWQQTRTGIYRVPLTADTAFNLVSINGTPQTIARRPNADSANGGWLTYTKGISATQIGGTVAGDYTGYQMILRPNEFRMEKVLITADNSDTLTFQSVFNLNNGNLQVLEPTKSGYGYFFFNDTSFLDKFGEWVYTGGYLYVFFGANNPASYTVKAGVLDTLFNTSSRANIVIDGLSFEGGNLYGIYATSGNNVTIKNCDFNQFGAQAIGASTMYNSLIQGNVINNCLQDGISIRTSNFDNIDILSNEFYNTGLLPGMGSFNQNDYTAISIFIRSGLNVKYNKIVGVGANGIRWQASDALIYANYIQWFSTIFGDTGGIYSYWLKPDGRYYTNRRIARNFILNSVGTLDGIVSTTTMRRVNGIYLDGLSANVMIDSNYIQSVSRCGFVCNCDSTVTYRDNMFVTSDTVTNNRARGIGLQQQQSNFIRNFRVTNNLTYLFASTQSQIYYVTESYGGNIWGNVSAIGVIDSNYVNYSNFGVWDVEYYSPSFNLLNNTLSQWRTNSGFDLNSRVLQNVTSDKVVFIKNWSANPMNYTLTAVYQNEKGQNSQGNIVISAYSAYFGIYQSAIPTPSSRKKPAFNKPKT